MEQFVGFLFFLAIVTLIVYVIHDHKGEQLIVWLFLTIGTVFYLEHGLSMNRYTSILLSMGVYFALFFWFYYRRYKQTEGGREQNQEKKTAALNEEFPPDYTEERAEAYKKDYPPENHH